MSDEQKQETIEENEVPQQEEVLDSTEETSEQGTNQLALVQQQSDEYLNNWKRAVADYQNLKKQQEKDRQSWVLMANADLILKLLPIIDDMEKAFETADAELKKTTWFEGMALIRKKLSHAFEESGVEEIKAEGEKFDPAFHEAVLHEQVEGFDADTVVHVLQTGYMMHGRLIRPAMVKVAK